MTILRDQLLAGKTVALAGAAGAPLRARLTSLGASLCELELPETPDDEAALATVRAFGRLDALVYDAGAGFGTGGQAGLAAALDTAWRATASVANGALIPANRGKVVLIAPPADAGPYADAARAALENLARTLSIEWARYQITSTAILPGPGAGADQLAEFVAFLISAAGDYYSGCRFELGSYARLSEP